MREILRNALHVLVWRWPALLAALIVGWVVHSFGIQLAAEVATKIPWLGIMILPFAILGYLTAYLVVFRLMRPLLPAYERLDREDLAVFDSPGAEDRGAFRTASDLATSVILPFFLMWAAWGFFDEDLERYRDHVWRRFIFVEGGPTERPIEFDITGQLFLVVLLLIAVAMKFLSEHLMTRFAIFGVIGAYFEALWVFLLSITVISPIVNVASWVGDSVMWHSIARSWDAFVESLSALEWLWSSVLVPAWNVITEVAVHALYPLAWFALAAIVMGRPVSDAVAKRALLTKVPRLERWVGRAREDWEKSPGPIKVLVVEISEDFALRAVSVVGALTALRRLGAQRIAGYVLAWVLLDWVNGWLMYLLVHGIGAQPNQFWLEFYNYALVLPWLLTELLRVALVGAAYDAALRRDAAELRQHGAVTG